MKLVKPEPQKTATVYVRVMEYGGSQSGHRTLYDCTVQDVLDLIDRAAADEDGDGDQGSA